MTTRTARPGRPRSSSRAAIEDAAGELFLERGFGHTTIEQITQRAGVSRATFFNYFTAKSDVLWSAFDDSAGRLGDELAAVRPDLPPLEGVRRAVLAVAEDFGPERAPWAATEAEVMGIGEELRISGLPRFAAQAALLGEHLRALLALPRSDSRPSAAAAAITAAVVSAAGSWVRAGTGRGPLAPYVDEVITPICLGFADVFRAPAEAGPRAVPDRRQEDGWGPTGRGRSGG
jgi:AcrR family transcriptional regulator